MAPTAIGTSTIAFGLVNVPVRMYPATQDHDVRFHQVHSADGGRIQYARVCTERGETVPYYNIDRCYVSPAGQKAIVTDDDLARLPAAEKAEIPVLQFVPLDQVDPILLHRSYYLEPARATPRAYALLAETLARTDRVAITHLTLHRKTAWQPCAYEAGYWCNRRCCGPTKSGRCDSALSRTLRYRAIHSSKPLRPSHTPCPATSIQTNTPTSTTPNSNAYYTTPSHQENQR